MRTRTEIFRPPYNEVDGVRHGELVKGERKRSRGVIFERGMAISNPNIGSGRKRGIPYSEINVAELWVRSEETELESSVGAVNR